MTRRAINPKPAALVFAPTPSQPLARLRWAVIEGWVASRYETLPGRALALRCWLDQLLAPRHQPHLLSTTIGSSASDLLITAERLQRIQRLCVLHLTQPQRPTLSNRTRTWFRSHRDPHPPLNPDAFELQYESSWRDPTADQHTLRNSHRLVVLWLRQSSRLAKQLADSLERDPHHPQIFIPDDARLIPPSWSRRLTRLQAQVIPVINRQHTSNSFSLPPPTPSPSVMNPRRRESANHLKRWLIHTTRASDQRRAGESRFDFYCRLLSIPIDQIGAPFITLRTILQQALLRGRSEPVRGKIRVVSWSATPLRLLLAHRKFRPGRRHWDYEPYGIAVPQELASHLGASPVIYGPPQRFKELPPEQRHLFQPIVMNDRQSSKTARAIDWSFEQEWRCIGDVPLVGPIAKHAIAFVPTSSEAEALQSLSPLRVLALDSLAGQQIFPCQDA